MGLFVLGFILLGLVYVTENGEVKAAPNVSLNGNYFEMCESTDHNLVSTIASSYEINEKINELQKENNIIKSKIETLKIDSEIADQYKELQSASDAICDISNALSLWEQAIQLGIFSPTGFNNEQLIKTAKVKNDEILNNTIQYKTNTAEGSLEIARKVSDMGVDITDISNIIIYQYNALEHYKKAEYFLNLFASTNSVYDFQKYVENAKLGHDKALEVYKLCQEGYSKYYNKIQETV